MMAMGLWRLVCPDGAERLWDRPAYRRWRFVRGGVSVKLQQFPPDGLLKSRGCTKVELQIELPAFSPEIRIELNDTVAQHLRIGRRGMVLYRPVLQS